MKSINELDSEIKEITDWLTENKMNRRPNPVTKEQQKLTLEYNKKERRLVFLRECRMYILENGNESYLKRFLDEANRKIEDTWDRAKKMYSEERHNFEGLRKEYVRNSQVPSLKKKIELVSFLLG